MLLFALELLESSSHEPARSVFIAGQILLLKNEERGVTHGKWVGPEHFQEIIVGTTMMTDHLPDRVFVAVNDYSENQRSGLNRV